MEQTIYDTIIIGAGPAGLAAAIYTARGNLSTLILEKGPTGGQISLTDAVENYPGFPEPETGYELADRLQRQAEKFGAELKNMTVSEIRRDDRQFVVVADNKELTARSVILAMGADPRKLGVPGEEKNVGTGVSYCATCDGAFFRGKDVIVVGGGDAAVEEGLFLTRYCNSVTIVHRRDQLRASAILQDRAFAHEKIHFIWDSVVEEIVSGEKVEKVVLRNVKTNEIKDHPIDGVFIFVGHIPNTKLVEDLVELDDHHLIKIDLWMRTNIPGLFACGDCRTDAARQMASSVGDGVTAAIAAAKYVDELAAEAE
ncbi:MAG: thioredoxin-disulfide reductase [Candidatus Omnitrophica bacterium]|nr:thioredoxin-disulfide reductase [Candidatus Omnitrophota bacterium]